MNINSAKINNTESKGRWDDIKQLQELIKNLERIPKSDIKKFSDNTGFDRLKIDLKNKNYHDSNNKFTTQDLSDKTHESTTSEKIQKAKNTFLKIFEDLKPIADKYDSLRDRIGNCIDNYQNRTGIVFSRWDNYFAVEDKTEKEVISGIYKEFQNITREYVEIFHENYPILEEMKNELDNTRNELKKSENLGFIKQVSKKIHSLFSTNNDTTKEDITKINNIVETWNKFIKSAFRNILSCEYDRDKECVNIEYYVQDIVEGDYLLISIENLNLSHRRGGGLMNLLKLSGRIDTATKGLNSI